MVIMPCSAMGMFSGEEFSHLTCNCVLQVFSSSVHLSLLLIDSQLQSVSICHYITHTHTHSHPGLMPGCEWYTAVQSSSCSLVNYSMWVNAQGAMKICTDTHGGGRGVCVCAFCCGGFWTIRPLLGINAHQGFQEKLFIHAETDTFSVLTLRHSSVSQAQL